MHALRKIIDIIQSSFRQVSIYLPTHVYTFLMERRILLEKVKIGQKIKVQECAGVSNRAVEHTINSVL